MTEQLAQLKPEKMNAADWLKAVHDIDPFHRPVGFVSKLCKNLKIFSNEQLVELFACRAITSQDFDENADNAGFRRKRRLIKAFRNRLGGNPLEQSGLPAVLPRGCLAAVDARPLEIHSLHFQALLSDAGAMETSPHPPDGRPLGGLLRRASGARVKLPLPRKNHHRQAIVPRQRHEAVGFY